MTSLLKVQNFSLDITSAGERTEILKDISFSIDNGETHALVGESGSGKSVTAMSILRLVEEIATAHSSGSITFNGHDIGSLDSERIRSVRGNEIAMIFQEPMTSLNPVYTVGRQLVEPLMLHQAMDKRTALTHAGHLLQRTGIKDPDYRINAYPHQLSGGQRQRVMIAMALACKPKLLIADEPTTALDVTVQGQILELIKDVQQEYGMSVLLITHDLPMVRQIADTVSIMHNGRIVEQGRTSAIFIHPEDPYTRHLLDSLPKGEQCPRPGGETLVKVQNLDCRFELSAQMRGWFKRTKKTIRAVDDVSVSIRQGTTLGVVGESGSGKSTFAMCLLKLEKYTGKVTFTTSQGRIDISSLSGSAMRPLRREMQIVFQDPFSSLSPRMSIEQIIGEGLRIHKIGVSEKEQRNMVQKALKDVELDPDTATRYPHEFSGGQRQRIAIARAIVLKPRLLILDEPTSALDMTIQKQIIDLLRDLQQRYKMTYIFITHDLRMVRTLADQLIVMQQGKIVEQGPADKVFSSPTDPYTKRLFQAAFH